MRKILIGILTILLIVMAVLVITKGLTIGNFKILSVKQIIEGNDKLTAEISETEKLTDEEKIMNTKIYDVGDLNDIYHLILKIYCLEVYKLHQC